MIDKVDQSISSMSPLLSEAVPVLSRIPQLLNQFNLVGKNRLSIPDIKSNFPNIAKESKILLTDLKNMEVYRYTDILPS